MKKTLTNIIRSLVVLTALLAVGTKAVEAQVYDPYSYYQPSQQYAYPYDSFSSNQFFGRYTFRDVSASSSRNRNDDTPDVDTRRPDEVDDDSAELNGEVDMNDSKNGIVFFVYGQDEDMIEDVEDDYDTYDDVEDDEDDDDFEVIRVDRDLDGDDRYSEDIRNLEEDEDYFYIICVEYEDDDNDEVLECGDVEDFETDDDNNNGNDDEPDVETDNATDISDDSAELRGEVDMNDFDNGRVFFVYGEDEDDVEDVEDEDRYSDIDENSDNLQKIQVESSLDGTEEYDVTVFNLDDDTEIFFRICVEYEDDDDDDTVECGDIEDFETDD